jgi:hypothetical protein
MLIELHPVGTRVRCKVTDLGDGIITGHIPVDGPYRVHFDSESYDENDSGDAHHRGHDEVEVIGAPRPKYWVAFNVPEPIEDVEALVRAIAARDKPGKFNLEETIEAMKSASPGDVFFIPNAGYLVLTNGLPKIP